MTENDVMKRCRWIVWPLLLAAAGLFAAACTRFHAVTWQEGNDRTVIFTVLFVLSVLVFALDRRFAPVELAAITLILAGLMMVRVCLLYYLSWDYKDFLHVWVEEMRGGTVSEAIASYSGNYNLPYMYLLLIISRFRIWDITLIKTFSCLFDLVLAYYVMKCVSLKFSGKYTQAAAFLLTLALPTVILNGACWGQCDSVYAAFCFASVYSACTGKSGRAVVCWTLAFAFKLQAIFLIPVLVILTVRGEIRWKDLWLVPVTYFVIMLPALILGRTLKDCLKIYYAQILDAPVLSVGAENIWLLLDGGSAPFEIFNQFAVYLAGTAAVFFTAGCLIYRKKIGTEELVRILLCAVLLIPYLLPRMHDRYFYLADVASLLYFIYNRKAFCVPLIQVYASFNRYRDYLFQVESGKDGLISLVILVLLTKLITDLFLCLKEKRDGLPGEAAEQIIIR